MWIVLLMYALFSSIFTVGKVVVETAQPFFLTGIRMLLAGVILLIYLGLRSPKKIYLKLVHIPLLILLALFNVFITNAFEFWGLQYMDTGKTSLIYSLSPFFAILLSYFFFSEKMTKRKWFGLGIGFLGFLPIFLTSSQAEKTSSNIGFFSLPEIALCISSFTAVVGWIVMKKLMEKYQYPFVTANALSFILGGGFSLLAAVFLENWNPLPFTSWSWFIFGVSYTAIIHNAICYNLYAYSLRKFTVPFMTFAGFSGPLFTAIYGWFFLNERVGIPFFLSFSLVFLGIYVYSRAEVKRKEASE